MARISIYYLQNDEGKTFFKNRRPFRPVSRKNRMHNLKNLPVVMGQMIIFSEIPCANTTNAQMIDSDTGMTQTSGFLL